MCKQKVIIVNSVNKPPQEELDQALAKLKGDWKVVSAITSMVPWGSWSREDVDALNTQPGWCLAQGSCKHLYFCTTVIVEKVV